MCLNTNWTKPEIATKDLKCWIVAKMIENKPYSYWREVPITKRMISALGNPIIWSNSSIEKGLHSFIFKKDAELMIKMCKEYDIKDVIALECYIPKGSKYYLGTFDLQRDFSTPVAVVKSYASNKRNLVKPLTPKKKTK